MKLTKTWLISTMCDCIERLSKLHCSFLFDMSLFGNLCLSQKTISEFLTFEAIVSSISNNWWHESIFRIDCSGEAGWTSNMTSCISAIIYSRQLFKIPKNNLRLEHVLQPGLLFTKRECFLLSNPVVSNPRVCMFALWSYRSEMHLNSAADDVPVKFQSDWRSQISNLVAWSLHVILR